MQSQVLSPSDLATGRHGIRGPVRVGGRIDDLGPEWLCLADALGRLVFGASSAILEGLAVGDFVVLLADDRSGRFVAEGVEVREAHGAPRGDGEWARFTWSGLGNHLAARDRAREAIRQWFREQRFIEGETPTWLRVPGLDSNVDALRAEQGWLVTSPELCMKRLLVGGVPRVYQFAKCFRREELGPRHEPEFTMLEWYRAFADLERILDDTEAIIVAAAEALGVAQGVSVRGQYVRLSRPFLRLSVAEAFRRHARVTDVDELARRDRERYFQLFVDRVEPALAGYEQPVFLHAYPASEAALARLCADDPRWAERAELYIGGVELCNAYFELNAPSVQRERFEQELARRAAENQPLYPIDERFLAALEEGMPPCSGNALGFDRLMMLLLERSHIGEVIAFPRDRL